VVPIQGDFTHLSEINSRKLTFGHDHSQGEHGGEKPVPNITEHDGEQERESHHREQAGIDLLIGGDAVTVHDGLEPLGKLVRPVEGRRGFVCTELVENGRHICSRFLLEYVLRGDGKRGVKTDSGMPQGGLDVSNVSGWAPTFRQERLPTGIIPEEVEGFVNSFLLDHNILPT